MKTSFVHSHYRVAKPEIKYTMKLIIYHADRKQSFHNTTQNMGKKNMMKFGNKKRASYWADLEHAMNPVPNLRTVQIRVGC